jgi:hypothetical protein
LNTTTTTTITFTLSIIQYIVLIHPRINGHGRNRRYQTRFAPLIQYTSLPFLLLWCWNAKIRVLASSSPSLYGITITTRCKSESEIESELTNIVNISILPLPQRLYYSTAIYSSLLIFDNLVQGQVSPLNIGIIALTLL